MSITTSLSLTEREIQAAFRALIEYRRILELSAIRDSGIIRPEIDAVDSLSEKISLAFHYPPGVWTAPEIREAV
jgi:hypothetical protein